MANRESGRGVPFDGVTTKDLRGLGHSGGGPSQHGALGSFPGLQSPGSLPLAPTRSAWKFVLSSGQLLQMATEPQLKSHFTIFR